MSQSKTRRSFLKRLADRHGAALVEFAIALPFILLILLGMLEIGRAVVVSHALQEAAQAGCRVYCLDEMSRADSQAIVDAAMDRAGLMDYTVEFSPETKEEIDEQLEPVTVTVSVPFASVAWLTPDVLTDATLKGQCVMPADFRESDGTISKKNKKNKKNKK